MKTNISESLPKIQAAISQFGFSAVVASNELVVVRNSKGVNAARVTSAGVEQLYAGAKNLCGALVVRAIKAVI